MHHRTSMDHGVYRLPYYNTLVHIYATQIYMYIVVPVIAAAQRPVLDTYSQPRLRGRWVIARIYR